MGILVGAWGHELFSVSLHPTLFQSQHAATRAALVHLHFVLSVVEYTLIVAFDDDLKTCIDQLLGSGRC